MAGMIGNAIGNLFLLLGLSLIFGVVFSCLIAKYSKSHLQVFLLTMGYFICYCFITLGLDIKYIYYDFEDLLPVLIIFPITHFIFFIRTKKHKNNLLTKNE